MRKHHRSTLYRAVGILGTIGVAGTLIGRDAHGDSVVQFMTAKSLPDATVSVIDPESGTSQGTQGQDVNLAVGDIILFRFSVASAPDGGMRGLQAYITEYIPPGTELVGVRIVDASNNTLEPRRAGRAFDGCSGGSNCNSNGSIAQLHADTGVFYSTDPLTGPTPDSAFLTLDNGIAMIPEPRGIDPSVVQILNDTSGTYYAHNDWDWDQVQAFGTQTSPFADGDGNTPHLYGSPVAGPDTHYRYEATDDGTIGLDGVDGPWERILYPGSQIGTGSPSGSTNTVARMGVDTVLGYDLTPLNPVAATAVRFALGEAYVGEIRYVEVALRVTSVPIDPTFGTAGGNVDCGEANGTGISWKAANTGGDTNPWVEYVGHPQCVFLRLKLDIEADKGLAAVGDTINYLVSGKNLSVNPETGAVLRLKYVESDQDFIASTPPPDSTFPCPGETNKTCLEYVLGTLAPSDEFLIDLDLGVGGQGGGTNVVVAQYLSNELTAIDGNGFSTTALTVVQPAAYPVVTLDNALDETTSFAVANGTTPWAMTGTVANAGTIDWTQDNLTIVLPTGFRVASGQITLGGVTRSCSGAGCTTASTQEFNIASSYLPLESRTLTFSVIVPVGTAPGLYPVTIQTVGGQTVFGTFESEFHELAFINVGQVRTQKPTVDCPIVATQPTISGTSEASAGIDLLFNLMERGNGTATAGGLWSIGSANFLASFGELYAGLEIRATAQVTGELPSEPSDPCFVTASRQCADGFDNDNDGLIDFPADPGCASPTDNDETNPPPPECSDGTDNNGTGGTDWPNDPSCDSIDDTTEDGTPSCSDGIDNDGDGRTDFPNDPDCTSSTDGTETFYRQCQDGRDNDGDGLADFPTDEGCHSLFDDDEFDAGSSPLDTKARLLLAVDSSGSMNWQSCTDTFTGGDGSTECAGSDVSCSACGVSGCDNLQPDDSRLFQVKSGLSSVVAAFGEVEYSLMRFHQKTMAFGCPTAAAGLQSGGWQGGGAAPCSGGFAAGDLLVSYAQDNEPTILDWMNHDSDYDGVAPSGTDFEIRGSGTTPLAGILTSAGTYLDDVRAVDPKVTCRPYRVILVTDGAETCGGSPTTAAAALLADGIPVHVIGFATPDPAVIATLDAIAAAGGTTEAILVNDEAALSAAIAQIIEESILVEYCNGVDDDCDSLVDEDFPDLGDACDNGELGECLENGTMVCSGNQLTTVCNAPPGSPVAEQCNGLDDDCDGLIDEDLGGACTCNPVPEICNGADDDCDSIVDEDPLPGVGETCGGGIGACEPGVLECSNGELVCVGGTGPATEVCDNEDNDCDSFVDDVSTVCYEFPTGCDLGTGVCQGVCETGLRGCVNGADGPCVGDVGPTPDLCDGVDNDCDGAIDEDYNLGAACDNGLEGACFATGTIVCDGQGGATCTAPVIPPGIEFCSGLDEDCDGAIDEDLGSPIGDTCGGGGGGSCTAGTFQCVDGQVECVGSNTGQPEVCNGFDDDCDMLVDEDVPGTGGDCVPPGFEQYQDIGECEFGHLECIGGQMDCRDYVGPSPEIPCNGIDEDCDGNDDVTCPQGQACVEDSCRNPCGPGEFPCPFGFYCEEVTPGERYCLPDLCVGANCPDGFGCEPSTGVCYDLCEGINCPEGTECRNGLCQDCFALGCPDGMDCVVNPQTDLGECVPDPCAGVTCDTGEFCLDGDCVPVACDPECPAGSECVNGQCTESPCADVECPIDQVCNPTTGQCGNECVDVTCSRLGEVCNPYSGDCIPDPCVQVDCPAGLVCTIEPDDTATCREPPQIPEEEIAAGGGGGCSTGGRSGGGAMLLIALAVLARRRGRARR